MREMERLSEDTQKLYYIEKEIECMKDLLDKHSTQISALDNSFSEFKVVVRQLEKAIDKLNSGITKFAVSAILIPVATAIVMYFFNK